MPFKVDETLINWVCTDAALADAVQQWQSSVLAIDSEFQRTDTFFSLPGLYQIFDGEQIYLLDPLAIDDWGPFVDVLEDARVVKVMHACSEDLELFFTHLGVNPLGLFDTQLAHAFLSPTFSISYANLVEHRCGELLDKGATRSNWRQRPLTEKQRQYAAADVWHLPQIYQQMHRELQDKGRLAWFSEEMARLRFTPNDPQLYYRNAKGAGKLAPLALARLQSLCAWRERLAMSRDVPRNRLVRDEHLLALAEQPSLASVQLRELLPPGIAKRYGADLIAAYAEPINQVPDALPAMLTPAQGKLVTAMRDAGKAQAQQLQMAPELLSRRREVEQSVRHYLEAGDFGDLQAGWRRDVLGDVFAKALQESPVSVLVEQGT